MRKRWLWLGGLALVAATTLGFAPYLPQLVTEGLPPLVGPANASYARVAGANAEPLRRKADATLKPLGAAFADSFAERQGAALVVADRGGIALEHYADGYSAETQFNSYSMVKGLVAGLIFRAIADGRIWGLDASLAEVLPKYPALGAVTVRQLLEMRSGIEDGAEELLASSLPEMAAVKATDTSPNPFGVLAHLHFQGLDAVGGGLRRKTPPNPPYNYQNINTALLGAIVEQAYAEPLELVLSRLVWQPAGAADALWRRPNAAAPVSAYCCLYARAEDWIRVGLFLIHNGTSDAPFLPDGLWRQYLGLDIGAADRHANHYGFHMWQNVLDRQGEALQGDFSYFMGQRGQALYLLPQQGVVVYRAGGETALLHSTIYAAWNASR